jgi:hypothetical protein
VALAIETFSSQAGASCFFKAVGHPQVAPAAQKLAAELRSAGPLAAYDPFGHLGELAELHDLRGCALREVYVQRLEELGGERLGLPVRPVSGLAGSRAEALLVAAFDAEPLLAQIRPLLPEGLRVFTLDALRLPAALVTRPERYLDPLNFATNYAFFRDEGGRHTRLVTANYWFERGGRGVALALWLLDAEGRTLAAWREALPDAPAGIALDSRELRRRFGLGPFTGSLFLHAVGAAGHDVVKYALDTWADDPRELSATHDANAWPADLYAGLPAPREGERALLWVQNSHPAPIPAGAIGLRRMGGDEEPWAAFPEEIPPFGTRALDVGELVPGLRWPAQLEVRAGRHFVRPRYELVRRGGRRLIAHANVERQDLAPDSRLGELGPVLGKGYLLAAPVLPPERWRTLALPTPMATCQRELPLELRVYDASGAERLRERLGRLPRGHAGAIDVGELLARAGAELAEGYGHLELGYDLAEGGEADGWLHALFRYEDRASGHAAETSFGAHVFNLPVTYRGEPQSYSGRPPGLSTRLFLRLGHGGRDTLCHLLYPVSGSWRERSSTRLLLRAADGAELAERALEVPRSGSHLFLASQLFGPEALARAGEGGYVLVRDASCRLFGYQGLLGPGGAFSLDHMFGF